MPARRRRAWNVQARLSVIEWHLMISLSCHWDIDDANLYSGLCHGTLSLILSDHFAYPRQEFCLYTIALDFLDLLLFSRTGIRWFTLDFVLHIFYEFWGPRPLLRKPSRLLVHMSWLFFGISSEFRSRLSVAQISVRKFPSKNNAEIRCYRGKETRL